MLRKILILIFTVILFQSVSVAAEIPVKVTPFADISTSTGILKEGDNIDFVVVNDVYDGSKLLLKKGTVVSGMVSSLEDNSFDSKEATILIDNFFVAEKGKRIKLKGSVYKTGNNHPIIYGISLGLYAFVRGGEAFVKPDIDFYTLYLEVKND